MYTSTDSMDRDDLIEHIKRLEGVLAEIAAFEDSESEMDEIMAFRWHVVKLARNAR